MRRDFGESNFGDERNFEIFDTTDNEPISLDIKNSYNLLNGLNNQLKETLSKSLSQSVFDLLNCFICLSPANDPLSCPKCNNFACRKCLVTYFAGRDSRQCGLCKQKIRLDEMKENTIIKEIEDIIDKDDTKKNKSEKLSKIIEEKKKTWESQTANINNIITRITHYQESLEKYRKQFDKFFAECQKVVTKTFEDYNQKTANLINSLLSFNKVADNSIQKYNEMNKLNCNNYYTNENIKSLINEILALERKHFNERNNNETNEFLNMPITLAPNIKSFKIGETDIGPFDEEDITESYSINTKNKLKNIKIVYKYNNNNNKNVKCKFTFTLPGNFNIFLTQCLPNEDKDIIFYPMELSDKQGNKYTYECDIPTKQLSIRKYVSTQAILFSID